MKKYDLYHGRAIINFYLNRAVRWLNIIQIICYSFNQHTAFCSFSRPFPFVKMWMRSNKNKVGRILGWMAKRTNFAFIMALLPKLRRFQQCSGLEGPSSRMLDDRNPATGSGGGLVKCVVEWHGWYEIIENMAWMATRMSAWLPMNRSESAGYPKNPARKNRIEKCGDRPTSSSLCVEFVFLALPDCKCNKINHSQESNRSSMKMNGMDRLQWRSTFTQVTVR